MGKRDWTTHITNINSLLLSKLLCWTIIHFIKSNWTTYNTKYTEPANNKLLNKLNKCDTNCKVRTLLDEDRWLFWLKALGWGLPIIPMLPYVAFRLTISHFHFPTFTFKLWAGAFQSYPCSPMLLSGWNFHTFAFILSLSHFHFHTFTLSLSHFGLGPSNHTHAPLCCFQVDNFTFSLSYFHFPTFAVSLSHFTLSHIHFHTFAL